MPNPEKDLTYFLNLPYPCELIAAEEGGFVAHHPDLVGCADQGKDAAEALEHLAKARKLWLQAKLKHGDPIPEPPAAEPSGRLMLRLPIRLHARLDRLAHLYGKSLNRLLNDLLFNYVNALPANHGLGKPAPTETEAPTATYAYRLIPLPDGGFVAEHPDLPGCLSEGSDALEAMANLDEARELWIQERQKEGLPVPEPLSADHTGLIHLRLPPALHADLVRDSQRNGSTLNQWIVCSLVETSVELENRYLSVGLRDRLLKELRELRIDVEAASVDELTADCQRFLLGLLYLKKQARKDAWMLMVRATEGDLSWPEAKEFLSSHATLPRALREKLGGPEIWNFAPWIVQSLPEGTQRSSARDIFKEFRKPASTGD